MLRKNETTIYTIINRISIIIKKYTTFWPSPLQSSQSFNGLRIAPEFELILTRKNGTSVYLPGYLIKELRHHLLKEKNN